MVPNFHGAKNTTPVLTPRDFFRGTLFGPTVLVQARGNRFWLPASPCLDLCNLSWSWTWQIWAPSFT